MYENELYHHGIKGMRWGVRRYQNEDGTLTVAGQKRRAKQLDKELGRLQKDNARLVVQINNARGGIKESYRRFSKYKTEYEQLSDEQKLSRYGKKIEKKGKDWLSRSIESAAISSVSKTKLEKNMEETNRLLSEISNNPNFLTYQQRRGTYGYSTRSEKKDMVDGLNALGIKTKKPRNTYDDNWANAIDYDRTRVRYSSEKERRKNVKRRTDRNRSQLVRQYVYYY